MRAIRFERFGEPRDILRLGEGQQQEPGRNQVRVRMRLAPVNPSDLMFVRGVYGKVPTLPATPGFEGMGVVEKSGGGFLPWLRGLKPGKRVAVIAREGGSWQESIVVSARHVIPMPDAIPDEQAASFFVNPVTALVMTKHSLQMKPGKVMLQTAAGSSLGRMIIRLSKARGFQVISLVRRREQIAELERLGSWKVLSTQDENVVQKVMELTGGRGVAGAIDAVGGATAMTALRCVAPGGKLVLYGTLSGQPLPLEPREIMTHGKSVEGFWLGRWAEQQSVFTMLGLFGQASYLIQQDVLTSPLGTTFPIEKITEAVSQAETPGKNGKVLLRISE